MTATVVRLPDRAWPSGWEQDERKDSCAHQWETLYVEESPDIFVEIDRCAICLTPRCSRTDEFDTQCTERRHHREVHIFESGMFEPLGGYLGPELASTGEES